MFNFKKNPKPSCFTSSSKFSSLTSENEFENKENSTFHVNRNNIYSLHENYTSKLSQTEDPNYQSNIHKGISKHFI